MVAPDVDGDGNLDLVVRREALEQWTSILLGDGLGGFTRSQIFDASNDGLFLDGDGDGKLDYFYMNETLEGGELVMRPGVGDGSVGDPQLVLEMEFARDLVPADLDGNGILDLLAIEHARNDSRGVRDVHFLLDTGPGTFVESGTVRSRNLRLDYEAEDFDGDGLTDIVFSDSVHGIFVYLNRTAFYACREGAINGGQGDVTDVLFVNDSSGNGRDRVVVLDPFSPFELRIDATPAGGSLYAAYAWGLAPEPEHLSPFFPVTASLCLPIAFHAPPRRLAPRAIWNTVPGLDVVLGEGTQPASPAPTILLELPALPRRGRFFVQAVMEDPGARNGFGDVTNGIEIRAR